MILGVGGVLARDAAGAIIGAVGVSGDTSDNDELCASPASCTRDCGRHRSRVTDSDARADEQDRVERGRAATWARCCAPRCCGRASVCARQEATRPLEPIVAGEDVMHGDLRDPGVVDRLLAGVDVLIHMAGTSVETPLPEIVEHNLRRAARGVRGRAPARRAARRVRELQSCVRHVSGRRKAARSIARIARTAYYGLSKVWGEAMARLYWDKHGIESICMRIGTVIAGDRPTQPRHLATWLANEDLIALTLRCIAATDVGFMAVWGVSDNTRSYWDNGLAAAARLPAAPQRRGLRRRNSRTARTRCRASRSGIRAAASPQRELTMDRLHRVDWHVRPTAHGGNDATRSPQ